MTTRKSLVRFGTWAAAIALGSGMVIGFGAARDGHEPAPGQAGMAPPEVSVAQVVSRDVRQWDEFTGRVSAVETVELRPRVGGPDPGDRGRELVEVLDLAAQFPARHEQHLRAPVFGR